MIDYLSPLLEEEPALDWQEPVRVPAADREEPGLPETVDSGKAGMEALHPAAAQTGVENLEGETLLDSDLSWAEPLEGRTVGSAVLDQRLRRTGRVSRLARGGGSAVTVTLPDRSSPAPALDLLDLDRAVQRDARRYDGGFTLY
ncbi:MAG: hypothetical protein Q4C76_03335 [Bacillota bacterium]|nr:hypothetical protein [Bacillota bacterium]